MDLTFFDRVDIGVWSLTAAAIFALAAFVVPIGRAACRSLALLLGLVGAGAWAIHAFTSAGVGV